MIDPAHLIVARAEARARHSRERLLDTLLELRHRLSPRAMAADAADAVAERAGGLAKDAGDAVKSRPLASAGGALAVVAAIALRHWLKQRDATET